MDGIPCVDRDKANRIVLSQQLEGMNAKLRDLIAHPPRSGSPQDLIAWSKNVRSLQDKLKGLNAINGRLNRAQTSGNVPCR